MQEIHRRILLAVVICWALAASCVLVATVVSSNNNQGVAQRLATSQAVLRREQGTLASVQQQLQVTQETQYLQILHTCERDNVRTALDNAANDKDYSTLLFATKHVPRSWVGKLKSSLGAKTWTPLIDCLAVGPEDKTPLGTAFAKKLPSAAAMSATNAAKPDPVGSISG